MEQWLLDNLLQMIVITVAGIIAFVKLSRFQDDSVKWRVEFSKVIEKLEANLTHHIESPMPHNSCPTHNAVLQEIRGVLSHIQSRISAQDDRMFARINELEKRLFEIIKEKRE